MARELKEKPLTRINENTNKKQVIKKDAKEDILKYAFPMGALFIIIILLGIFSNAPKNFSLYYFGFLFFIAGFLLNVFNQDKKVTFFFFSHGVIGFIMMVGTNVLNILKNPVFKDGPTNINVYMFIALFCFIAAIIPMIKYRLFSNMTNEDKKYTIISLALFTISDAIIILLPYLIR